VKLLERQPEIAPDAPPEPGGAPPQEQPAAEPATRACATCGAAMEPGQDWCLQCGTASRPLGERPGWRSAMTVLGLTLMLVAGAVAASFAALSDDRPAPTAAVSTGDIAQVPPPAATTAPPADTTTTPATGDTNPENLPKVDAPSSGRPSSPSSPKPVSPAPTGTTRSVAPTPTPTPTPTPSSGSAPSGSTGSGSSGSGSSGSGTSTPRPAPAAIELADSAATVYDPYGRATATGAPGRALDGDAGTSWFVDPPAGAQTVAVGYSLNLGEQRGIRVVELTTSTPGFRVEVYASDEATAPPNILDTRWAHITDKSDVGADEGGTTRIVLGAGTSKYQTLLLWITTPPSDGARVRISELKVLG
jgi:hypothetical protein